MLHVYAMVNAFLSYLHVGFNC